MKNMLFNKRVVSWFFYDWAISVFPTIVTTFIFATYFTEKVAINKIIGTAQWGEAIALSALVVALMSPILGSIADNDGRRKPWLALFTFFLVLGSAILWFVKPNSMFVNTALVGVIIGGIGSEVVMVFYNPMLRDLVQPSHIGRMSGWSWGFGYFGGLTGLVVCLVCFINDGLGFLNLDHSQFEHIRIVGPFVAVWVLAFSIPLFIFVPDRPQLGVSLRSAVKQGIIQLFGIIRSFKSFANIFKFLLARMIYIDGLNTVFAFGGIYAAGQFNLNISQIIIFGITMHVSAGLGAIGFAWLDDWLGPKFTILLSLGIMSVSAIFMINATSFHSFWLMGLVLCLCVGPIQAASRSLMIRISPKEMLTEFFGLYALSGRATAFIGPWILGLVTLHFNSQRIGMSTVLWFLVGGGLLLLLVKVP